MKVICLLILVLFSSVGSIDGQVFKTRPERELEAEAYIRWINYWITRKPLKKRKLDAFLSQSTLVINRLAAKVNEKLSTKDRLLLARMTAHVYRNIKTIAPSYNAQLTSASSWRVFRTQAEAADCIVSVLEGRHLLERKKHALALKTTLSCVSQDDLSKGWRVLVLDEIFSEVQWTLNMDMNATDVKKKMETVGLLNELIHTDHLNIYEVKVPTQVQRYGDWSTYLLEMRSRVVAESQHLTREYLKDQYFLEARKEAERGLAFARLWGFRFSRYADQLLSQVLTESEAFYRNLVRQQIADNHYDLAHKSVKRMCAIIETLSVSRELEVVKSAEQDWKCSNQLKALEEAERYHDYVTALDAAKWLKAECAGARLNGLDLTGKVTYLSEQVGRAHFFAAEELFNNKQCFAAIERIKVARTFFPNDPKKYSTAERKYKDCATRRVVVYVQRDKPESQLRNSLYRTATAQLLRTVRSRLGTQPFTKYGAEDLIVEEVAANTPFSVLQTQARSQGGDFLIVLTFSNTTYHKVRAHAPKITYACRSWDRYSIDPYGRRCYAFTEYKKDAKIRTYTDRASASIELDGRLYDLNRKSLMADLGSFTIKDNWSYSTKYTPTDMNFNTLRFCPVCLNTKFQTNYLAASQYNQPRPLAPSVTDLIGDEILAKISNKAAQLCWRINERIESKK